MSSETNFPKYPDCDDPNSFENGLKFQDFVTDYLLHQKGFIIQNFSSKYYQYNYGENPQGIEIKLDRRCTDTGRCSIEVGERSSLKVPSFTPSGILRGDNSWLYITGNYKIFFLFSSRHLKNYYEAVRPVVIEDRPPTIRKFYMDFDRVVKNCERVFVIDPDVLHVHQVIQKKLEEKPSPFVRAVDIPHNRKSRKEPPLFGPGGCLQ